MTTRLETQIETTSGFENTYLNCAEAETHALRREPITVGIVSENDPQFSSESDVIFAFEGPTVVLISAPEFKALSEPAAQRLDDCWKQLSQIFRNSIFNNINFETGAAGPTASRNYIPTPAMPQRLRPLSEVADELAADIPDAEWDKVPTDLAKNLDHYLYGAPKEGE